MKRAQTTGPKIVIFTPLLGQIGGLLGQWPTSYNVKKCPAQACKFCEYKINLRLVIMFTHVSIFLCVVKTREGGTPILDLTGCANLVPRAFCHIGTETKRPWHRLVT